MLRVNLDDPTPLVERSIEEQCAKIGRVKSVKLHLTGNSPFAVIEMATEAESDDLRARFAGSTFGVAALVHLEHEETPTPERSA
jgi:hypothetical protein